MVNTNLVRLNSRLDEHVNRALKKWLVRLCWAELYTELSHPNGPAGKPYYLPRSSGRLVVGSVVIPACDAVTDVWSSNFRLCHGNVWPVRSVVLHPRSFRSVVFVYCARSP